MKPAHYPFVPKSTAYLKPGDFWSIPLADGQFACGRVLQLKKTEKNKFDSRAFLAGLIDWCGETPPTSDAIADRKLLEFGRVHVKTIAENNGQILGSRPLESDGIAVPLCLDSAGPNTMLQRGFEILRSATAGEMKELRTLRTWGYSVIKISAEKHFAKRSTWRSRDCEKARSPSI